jgi:predicted amidohydrolase YtcJ
MKYLNIILAMVLMIFLISSGKIEKADLVIVNAKVLTIDNDNPIAEAVAVKGEEIISVGPIREISRLIKNGTTKVIDAHGRLVIPGFNDAHVHFGPIDPDYIELRYTTDPSVITEKVKNRVAVSKPGELIEGGHWEHEMFTTGKWPSKELIDAVSPDNPVVLSRADGHSVLVNSYVLNKSGITGDTPDPFGGEIQKDPVTGEPTGILKENAQKLIRTGAVKISRSKEETAARTWKGYLMALEEARKLGVTSIQIPGRADFYAYDKLLREDLLTARIDIGESLTDDTAKLAKYASLRKKYPASGNWIRFGYLKGFIDGTIGSGTALMFEPFNDNPVTTGCLMRMKKPGS